MNTYEATIYERAEHWQFAYVVEAASLDDAYKAARAAFGKGFRVVQVVRA